MNHIQPFIYTAPDGVKLEVLFDLDPAKKGYINATAIAARFGREPKDWLRNENVQIYIKSLIKMINTRSANSPNGTKSTTYNDIIVTIQGGSPEQQGTWLHPRLAVIFARWLSPDFAVWCDKQIVELLRQRPEYQQQFTDLSQIFDRLEASQQQFKQEINQRFHAIEQRFDTTEKTLNHFHARSIQETKHMLGQIHNGIRQLDKAMRVQTQIDLLQPSTQEITKNDLIEYQQILEKLLRKQKDELIQGYLVKIQEYTYQIVQRLPAQPAIVAPSPIEAKSLITEIAKFRATGQSWNAIAQDLNTRSTPTASGKGKWYGSSVKKYLEK